MTKAYLFIFFTAAGVASFSVVDVVYFTGVGYTLVFVGVMVSVFNISVTLSELPFAILFDRYSNKKAIQIGNAVRLAALALFFVNLGEPSLLAAQALAGVAVAASSGTANALVVNEIRSSKPSDMAAAFGRIAYVSAAGGILGGLLGGYFYSIYAPSIWLLAIAFLIAAAISIGLFKDVREMASPIPWRDYFLSLKGLVTKQSFVVLVLSNAAAVAPFILWQIKFNQSSLLFLVVGFVCMKLASLLAPTLSRILHVKPDWIGFVALANVVAAALFAIASPGLATLVSFTLHVMLQALMVILASSCYHAEVTDNVRASAGSLASLADSLVVAAVAPLVSFIGQAYGIGYGISISCFLYALVGLMTLRPQYRDVIRAAG